MHGKPPGRAATASRPARGGAEAERFSPAKPNPLRMLDLRRGWEGSLPDRRPPSPPGR
jgi:hypothetical protein